MLTPGHLFIHPARRARRRGDWAAARRAYGWALRLGAREAGIWMQYGHCAKEAGDPAAALRAYAEAERRRRPPHLRRQIQYIGWRPSRSALAS